MGRKQLGDGLRIVLVMAAAIAALGSATSGSQQTQQTQQQPAPYGPMPQQPQAQQQFTPCEYACGQIARCNFSPYDACLAQCRANGTEQQPAGAQQLTTIANMTCEQLQATMQGGAQPQVTQAPQQTAPTAASGQGEIETEFATPLGYTAAQQGGWAVFTPSQVTEKTPCIYGLAPSRASSGSLANDAAAALLEGIPGWERSDGSSTQMKGTAPAGWSYHWMMAPVRKLSNGSYQYLNATAMAFPASAGRVNILFGYGSNVHCMG
ncbi:MAG TPA: hypothetical protein VMZ53_31955, partial [Kofleriaceae bacterium]|nr:hypothetical protein [Kofleriaceae bacterium]